jgi:hypothetical protein
MKLKKKILRAFTHLKLDDFHPIIESYPVTCSKIFKEHLDTESHYCKLVRSFLFDGEPQNKINDSSESITIYKLCHDNDINCFAASKYLTSYCQTTLENILNTFKFANISICYKEVIHSQQKITAKETEKIFDTLFVIILANIFSIIDQCEKISKFKEKYFGEALNSYQHIISTIDRYGINSIQFSEKEVKSLSLSNNKTTINAWQMYRDTVFDLLSKNNDELIDLFTNNMDLYANLCLYKTISSESYHIDKECIIKYLFTPLNFYFVMNILTNKENFEKNYNFEFVVDNIKTFVVIDI